jgi:hypothetical protein
VVGSGENIISAKSIVILGIILLTGGFLPDFLTPREVEYNFKKATLAFL